MVTILQAKKMATPDLMAIPGVVGVGISTIKNIINVYVEKITDWILLQIPKEVEGYKTEVIEIGEVILLQDRTDKWRPAPGGVSIGHPQVTAGTFGAPVLDNVSGKRVILSNNHILANQDAIQYPRANKGDEIWQPGRADGGSSADTIAHLERWIKWDTTNPMTTDCAIATPINDVDITNEVLEVGDIKDIGNVTEGMAVKKSGRTTGLTTGTIVDTNMTVTIGAYTWDDQIRVTGADPIIKGGDSGSGVFDEDNNLVGLAFAGPNVDSPTYYIANKMTNVADLLDISIKAPTPPPPERAIWPYLLGGGAALMVLPMMIKPAKKPPKKPARVPERKTVRNLLIAGGLAAAGIGLYFYLKKTKINVNSTPSGASVYLAKIEEEGKLIGITPIKDYEIEPGTYALALILEDYEPYLEIFTIDKRETKTFNITLIPIEIPEEPAMDITYLTVDVK